MKQKIFYKSKPPYDTIHTIREILYNTGIFTAEYSGSTQVGFFNSHLYLAQNNIACLNLVVNGKGTTPEYSLASAYGEFMERLQNNWKLWGERYATKLFLKTLPPNSEYVNRIKRENLELDFELYPDEKKIKLRDLLCNDDKIFENLISNSLSYLKDNYDLNREILCVPYFNAFHNNLTYLPPKNVILGTNGLCAGNTVEEALIQGLCEIFERYAVRQVFLQGIIPPIIPHEYFNETEVLNKINILKNEKQIETIILDASLNIGLPVIGILFIDKVNKLYTFSFGGATDPVIALERCLTEIYQSDTPEIRMNKIYNKKYTQVLYPGRNEEEIRTFNYIHQVTHGGGELDIEEFLIKESTYSFEKIHTIEGNTYREEFNNLINLIKSLNWDLLIRDNSILDFPSYSIYIPNISEVFSMFNDDDYYMSLKDEDLFPILINLKNSSPNEIKEYCDYKDQLYDRVRDSFSNIKGEFLYHSNAGIDKLEPFIFMASLFYYIHNDEKTLKYINRFIQQEKVANAESDLTYFYAIRYYLILKIKGFKSHIIEKKLKLFYSEDIVIEVLSDMHYPEKALQYHELPTCFECEKCLIITDCKYFDVMSIVKKIHTRMRKNIDQKKLKELFV